MSINKSSKKILIEVCEEHKERLEKVALASDKTQKEVLMVMLDWALPNFEEDGALRIVTSVEEVYS